VCVTAIDAIYRTGCRIVSASEPKPGGQHYLREHEGDGQRDSRDASYPERSRRRAALKVNRDDEPDRDNNEKKAYEEQRVNVRNIVGFL